MLPETATVIQKLLDEYEAIPRWDTLRTERTSTFLPIVLERVEGDILEIGAHRGTTTNVFCKIGAQYKRQVFVIDPWDGRQQGSQAIYQQFQAATKDHSNLVVHRMGSENPSVLKEFQKNDTKFAYILIDGLHTYDAVKNDLKRYKDLLEPHGVICIDDWCGPYGFSAGIQRAAHEHLDNRYYHLTTPDSFIETYFIKLS